MKKNVMYTLISLSVFVCAVFYTSNVQSPAPKRQNAKPERDFAYAKDSKTEPEYKNTSEDENENINVGVSVPHVTKYILKYYNNKVMLICEYSNGKKTESEVTEINVNYLTETDKKSLSDGIVLKNSEEVYKLIEDYSS